MTIQDYRKLLQDQEYLTQTIIPLYQQEEDKLNFAKMKLLHLFFENGIQQHYNIQYLETLCSLLEHVCSQVFSEQVYSQLAAASGPMRRLLHYALPADLQILADNLRIYEVIFVSLEAYEVCANLTYLHQKVIAEINRKITQEPQAPQIIRLL